jgi:GNAT superfamily N-acetyltransferase
MTIVQLAGSEVPDLPDWGRIRIERRHERTLERIMEPCISGGNGAATRQRDEEQGRDRNVAGIPGLYPLPAGLYGIFTAVNHVQSAVVGERAGSRLTIPVCPDFIPDSSGLLSRLLLRRRGMSTHYYKRFRMEVDLTAGEIVVPALPESYSWQAWKPGLEERHALAKSRSFEDEVDSTVFECLGDYSGCLRLMQDIAQQAGFIPGATWLLCQSRDQGQTIEDCGTIQAVALTRTLASIQNVGVIPGQRGRQLGLALVHKCLAGCQAAGLHRVALEVTASNRPAVELYRRAGFSMTRTMYRTVEPALVGV